MHDAWDARAKDGKLMALKEIRATAARVLHGAMRIGTCCALLPCVARTLTGNMTTPKAYIQTFGCQMNEHDSYRMVEVLARQGYAMTEEVERGLARHPQYLLGAAKPGEQGLQLAGPVAPTEAQRFGSHYRRRRCVAQQEGEKILERERCVDMVFGPTIISGCPK